MYCIIYTIASDFHLVRILCRTGCSLYILWQVNQYRARLSGPCNMKCHLYDFSKVLSVTDCNRILCDISGDSDYIHFLKGIISDKWKRYLSCKAHKRHIVIMRICKTCNCVGSSGTACHKADTHLACRLGIALSLMNQALLMSRQNQID